MPSAGLYRTGARAGRDGNGHQPASGSFVANDIYEFSYTAKDPTVRDGQAISIHGRRIWSALIFCARPRDERLPQMSIERLIGPFSPGRRRVVLVKKAADRAWKATGHPGVERSLFRNNETGGRSSVVRLSRGSRFPKHAHEGTEEVVVLSGTVRIGGAELAAGDYLFTSPGEEHDVVALSDATIFVSSQRRTPVVE